MITEAELILSTTELPEGRAVRSRELLSSAITLVDDLLASHFRKLAAMRKTRAGGRPRKDAK